MGLRTLLLSGTLCCAAVTIAHADVFSGTLYYTNFTGGENVNSVSYTYDSVTKALTLGTPTGIAALAGADGIIFDASGRLLVGGQGTGEVFRLNKDGTGITSVSAGSASFHEALSPDGTKDYTSTFGGPLDIVPLSPFSNGTANTVTGSDGGLTQIAFAPDGTVFYVNGSPNGNGNLGRINLTSFVTDRFASTVGPAHGLVYDSFTGFMTIFGAGGVGTFDPTKTTDATLFASLKTRGGVNGGDFDQGAVDGFGHAFVAGSGEITFIDYSATGDITNASDTVIIKTGFGGIDDLAPLSGLGSNAVPEPASIVLLITVVGTLAYSRRRRTA